MSGGTIPDRGLFRMRHAESNAMIGELDEEFVWESSEGQSFTLGTQSWTIRNITHNDVFVTPGAPKNVDLPFWKGEGANRDYHFSRAIGEFLEIADAELGTPALPQRLQHAHRMDEVAAGQLVDFLARQTEHTGVPPSRIDIICWSSSSAPVPMDMLATRSSCTPCGVGASIGPFLLPWMRRGRNALAHDSRCTLPMTAFSSYFPQMPRQRRFCHWYLLPVSKNCCACGWKHPGSLVLVFANVHNVRCY